MLGEVQRKRQSEKEKTPWSEDGNQVEQYVRRQSKGFWRSKRISRWKDLKTEHCILALTKKSLVSFTHFYFIFNGAYKAGGLLVALT